MPRKAALSLFLVLLVGGILYLFRGTFETVEALAVTTYGLVVPADKPAPAAPTVIGGPVKADPLTGFAQKFSGSLMSINEGTPQDYDARQLAGVKYYAFFYSASWSPAGKDFTPELVHFYRDFKPSHPNFELIFVNLDHSSDNMLDYMRSDGMPWPAIRYTDIDDPGLETKKYCGSGIPCLVLVDSDGAVLSDTFQNGQYTDPHHVIADIRSMVK
jgi:nucleoredoxin